MIQEDLIQLAILDKNNKPHFIDIENLIDRKRLTHDVNLPYIVWEYGLEALIPLVPKMATKKILENGIQWLKYIGTDEGMVKGLNLVGVKTYSLDYEPDPNWMNFQLSFNPLKDDGTINDNLIKKVVGICKLSISRREKLVRIFHDYNVPTLKWSCGTTYNQAILSDRSGIKNYNDTGIKLSINEPIFMERPIGIYHNRFEKVDNIENYVAHRFYPRPAQAAELNEIQSRFSYELNSFSSTQFSEGQLISGGNISLTDKHIVFASSIYFLNGRVVTIPDSIVERLPNGVYFLSLDFLEIEVTEKEDPRLKDPDTETDNFGQPGATRLKQSYEYRLTLEEPKGIVLNKLRIEYDKSYLLWHMNCYKDSKITVGKNADFERINDAIFYLKNRKHGSIDIISRFIDILPPIFENIINLKINIQSDLVLNLSEKLEFKNCHNISFSGEGTISGLDSTEIIGTTSQNIQFKNLAISGPKKDSFKNIHTHNLNFRR